MKTRDKRTMTEPGLGQQPAPSPPDQDAANPSVRHTRPLVGARVTGSLIRSERPTDPRAEEDAVMDRMSRVPSGRPSRPARTSIRVDDVGSAVDLGGVHGPSATQVPRIVRSKDEIADAPIDHRAGFLLAHIDGGTTVQGLVDIAGMPENEVHEILERLRRLGIVAVR